MRLGPGQEVLAPSFQAGLSAEDRHLEAIALARPGAEARACDGLVVCLVCCVWSCGLQLNLVKASEPKAFFEALSESCAEPPKLGVASQSEGWDSAAPRIWSRR